MPTRNEAVQAMLDLPATDYLDAMSSLLGGSSASQKASLRALLGPSADLRQALQSIAQGGEGQTSRRIASEALAAAYTGQGDDLEPWCDVGGHPETDRPLNGCHIRKAGA